MLSSNAMMYCNVFTKEMPGFCNKISVICTVFYSVICTICTIISTICSIIGTISSDIYNEGSVIRTRLMKTIGN